MEDKLTFEQECSLIANGDELPEEKQIEEMANDIPYLTLSREVFVNMTEMKKVGWTLSEEDNKVIAEVLVKHGYRKIPEDSVVLSREEYENIYEQAEQNVLANIADGGTSCHWCIEQHEKKASKETAEKCNSILEKNYKDWLKVLNDLNIDTSNKNILVSIVCGLFKNSQEDIAKQFGVEVKDETNNA